MAIPIWLKVWPFSHDVFKALQHIAASRPLVSCSAPCEHHTDRDVYDIVTSLNLVDENELVAVLRPGLALTAGDMSHLQEGSCLHDSIIHMYLALLQVMVCLLCSLG